MALADFAQPALLGIAGPGCPVPPLELLSCVCGVDFLRARRRVHAGGADLGAKPCSVSDSGLGNVGDPGLGAVACLSGIDLQFGNRLYPSVLIYDFNVRTAFIDGIARHGLPATNPLFFPGHSVPLRYHYFWFISCALVDRLGGSWVNARQVLIASDVWCGWALMAIVVAYLRFFHPAGERGIGTRAKWGIALLAIAGLDILPNLLFAAVYSVSGAGLVFASSEWWNNPVTGFPTPCCGWRITSRR